MHVSRMSTDVLIIIKSIEQIFMVYGRTQVDLFLPSVNSDDVKIDLYIWTFQYLMLVKNTSTYLIVTCLTTRGKRLRR